MRNTWRYLFHFTLIVFAILLLSFLKLISYGIDQFRGQLNIIQHTVTVTEALSSGELSAEEKEKLLLIDEIKKFATDSLGLNTADNYTTFYNQHNKPVLWVISVCPAYELKPVQWKFPLIGYVSYKGFFEKSKALPDYDFFFKQGYDVDLSPVSAWSTLGFFKDPILSNFLKRGEGQLAELIIHELTHATIYNKSSVDYNENLATFIGEQGAIRFLNVYYGDSSMQLINYYQNKHDEELYGDHLMKCSKILDSLYKSFTPAMSDTLKKELKQQYIRNFMVQVDTMPFFNKKRYHFDLAKRPLLNNTDFMMNETYRGLQIKFEKQLKLLNNNLREFIVAEKQHSD